MFKPLCYIIRDIRGTLVCGVICFLLVHPLLIIDWKQRTPWLITQNITSNYCLKFILMKSCSLLTIKAKSQFFFYYQFQIKFTAKADLTKCNFAIQLLIINKRGRQTITNVKQSTSNLCLVLEKWKNNILFLEKYHLSSELFSLKSYCHVYLRFPISSAVYNYV